MRAELLTATGEEDIRGIFLYLNAQTPSATAAYYRLAMTTFADFPDGVRTQPRAGDHLPEKIRVLHLGSPFRGYTLRVA